MNIFDMLVFLESLVHFMKTFICLCCKIKRAQSSHRLYNL